MIITDLVAEIILEVGEDSADSSLSSKLVGFAKSALRRFPLFMRNRMLEDRKSGTLAANASSMTRPAGISQIRKVYYEDDGERIEILRPKLDRFTEEYRGNAVGVPQYFIERGNTIEFDRKNDVERTIYFEAFVEVDAVTGSTEWTYGSEKAEILKDGIKFYYFASIEDQVNKTDYAGLFKDGLDRLEKQFARDEQPDHVEEA